MRVNLVMFIILAIISIILVIRFFFRIKEGLKNKHTSKCDKKGCPISKTQNDIYKMHVEYKPIRDKNQMIANNTKTGNFIFKAKGPANIFIIRHGEKIKSKVALDCNGILRSTYIPSLIEDLNEHGFGIHSIITSYDYESMHQEQTISLSSWLLSIPIYMYGEQTDTEIAIKNIFTNPYFSGKTVLICWEHNCIQTLIKNIITTGAKIKGLDNYVFKNLEGNSKLPYWDTNNYKTMYHFDENLNFKVLEEKFTTCYKYDNNLLVYGKKQKCGSK